jgi:hypothetical protein
MGWWRENNGACKRESGGGKRIVVFNTLNKLEGLPLTNMYTKIGLELSTMEESMTKMEWERGATRAGWRRQEWKGWWVEEKRGKAALKAET